MIDPSDSHGPAPASGATSTRRPVGAPPLPGDASEALILALCTGTPVASVALVGPGDRPRLVRWSDARNHGPALVSTLREVLREAGGKDMSSVKVANRVHVRGRVPLGLLPEIARWIVGRGVDDGCRRRLGIQALRVLGVSRRGPEPGGERRIAHDPRRQRVERHDAQARRMQCKRPTAARVLGEHRERELARHCEVRLVRIERLLSQGRGQRLDDALAHLAGGLAREGEREDALGLVDAGQQREHALDQELGLAGACRRLHEERTGDVERPLARCRGLSGAGQLALYMGRYADARLHLEESLAIAREIDDPERATTAQRVRLGHQFC